MHELSIAQSIVEIISREIPRDQLNNVRSIRVKIGEMAGVVPESLDFSFMAITRETPLGSAALKIDHVPLAVRCNNCNATSQAGSVFPSCPLCESANVTVVSGTELEIIEIELADVIEEHT